jgi:hypothetical protein
MERIVGYRLKRQTATLSLRESNNKWPLNDSSPSAHDLYSLEYLCELFAQTQCSIPRDRIYSLLSLVGTDTTRRSIVQDYSKAPMDVLTDLIDRYCDVYPVFKLYHKDALGKFREGTRFTKAALKFELKRRSYNQSGTLFRLEPDHLQRYALLWAFMLEVTDPEPACRSAIRASFYSFHRELLDVHPSPVPGLWYYDISNTTAKHSDAPSILETDRDLLSRGILAFNSSKGIVDWIKSCADDLWLRRSLMHTVHAGNNRRS